MAGFNVSKSLLLLAATAALNCGGSSETEDPIEDTNTESQALVTGIDLTFQTVFNNERVWGVDLLVLDHMVMNNGTVASTPSVVKFYLSTDNVFSAATDIHLLNCDGNIPALASNTNTGFLTGRCNPPASTPIGRYWVFGRTDATATNAEANEVNNVQLFLDQDSPDGRVSIGPDLASNSQVFPTVIGTNLMRFSNVARSLGTKNVPATQANFYLSADGVIGTGDTLLCSSSVPQINVINGNNASFTKDCSVPSNLTGTYQVLAQWDSTSIVAEANETNNVSASTPFAVGIDLRIPISSIISPRYRLSGFDVGGSQIAINYAIENVGTRPSLASTVKFYLSTDTVFDGTDTLLCSFATGVLAPKLGSVQPGGVPTTLVQCPTGGVNLANKYVIEVVDATGTNFEVSETNNKTSDQIKAKPDYTLTAFTSGYVAATNRVTPTVTVKNQGNAAPTHTSTNFVRTNYVLSTNTTLDSADISLPCISSFLTLGIGASVNSSPTNCTVPTGVHGTYYVLALTDASDMDKESNEVNNLRATASTITIP